MNPRIGTLLLLTLCLGAPSPLNAQGATRWLAGGHSGPVVSVAYSPSDPLVATGSSDGTVKLWHLPDGALVRSEAIAAPLTAVAFAPDGKTFAGGSGLANGSVSIWRTADGVVVQQLNSHNNTVTCLAYSPDGKTLASGGEDDSIVLSNPTTGATTATLLGHTDTINAVTFSPDSKTLVSTSYDNTVRVWNVGSQKLLKSLGSFAARSTAAAFSTDGNLLAVGFTDNTLHLWNTSNWTPTGTISGFASYLTGLQFSNATTLFSADASGALMVWNAQTRKALRTLTTTAGTPSAIALSPDGSAVLSGDSAGNTAYLFRASDGKQELALSAHAGTVQAVAITQDGKTVASGSADGTVKLWHVGSGGFLSTFTIGSDAVQSVAFTPDGSTLACSLDNSIQLWKVATGVQKTTLTANNTVLSIAISPDGTLLASGNNDGSVQLWRLSDNKLLHTLTGHTNAVSAVTFAPNSAILVSGSQDGTLRLWNSGTGALTKTITLPTPRQVYALAYAPDGTEIASGDDQGNVTLWSTASGKQLQTHLNHTGTVGAVAFAYGGAHLLSAGLQDATITCWNLPDKSKNVVYTRETGTGVTSLAFTPEGSLFAYGRVDATLAMAYNPLFPRPVLNAVSVSPATVLGGATPSPAGTVTLSSIAPYDGVSVALADNAPATLTVPSSIAIPAGQATGMFPTRTVAVTTTVTATITAKYLNVARQANLLVREPYVTKLASSLATIPSGGAATGTVTLEAAPSAGAVAVNLSSGNSLITVPASITVAKGQTSATFKITAGVTPLGTPVKISAYAPGQTPSISTVVTVQGSLAVKSLALNPTSVTGGKTSTGTATLSAAAPTGGVTIALSTDNKTVATVPNSVVVPANATSVTFTIQTSAVTATKTVTISASLNGATQHAPLTVTR